jgi:hypothetical protein
MKLSRTMVAVALVAAAGVAAALVTPTAQAKDDTILFLDCFSVSMDAGVAGDLQIGIERWSNPDELEQLKTVLVEQGSDKLLKAVQKIKPRAGFIRTTRSLGWDLYFAQKSELPGGGTKVIFISDRPISTLGAMRDDRSTDYAFQLGEIHFDKDMKKGAGTYVGAGEITYNKKDNQIEIENYGAQPIRFTDVQVRK